MVEIEIEIPDEIHEIIFSLLETDILGLVMDFSEKRKSAGETMDKIGELTTEYYKAGRKNAYENISFDDMAKLIAIFLNYYPDSVFSRNAGRGKDIGHRYVDKLKDAMEILKERQQ